MSDHELAAYLGAIDEYDALERERAEREAGIHVPDEPDWFADYMDGALDS